MAFSGTYDVATITNPSSALTDFTLMIDLSLMSSAWWTAVSSSDGTKGRAAKEDGVTELATDWIDFDDTGETGWLRVNWTGTLASSGTQELRIYPPISTNSSYGVSDTYGQYNVYKSVIEGYYPLGGGTDRTGNQLTLSATGGVTEGDTSSTYGDSTDYDGSTQYFSGAAPITASPLTFMSMVNPDTTSIGGILSLADSSTGTQQYGLSRENAQTITAVDYGGSYTFAATSSTLGVGTWGHATAVIEAIPGDARALLDGGSEGTKALNTAPTGIDTFGIGATMDISKLYFNGQVCHSFIVSEDVGNSWVVEESDQLSDNATFWGTWTNVPVGPPTGNTPTNYYKTLLQGAA